MSLLIQRLNGIQYDTSNYNLRLIEFDPDSPDYKHSYDEIDGRDGAIDKGTTVGVRKLKARFNAKAVDMYDIALLRNEIFNLFHSKEAFYIIDQREPGKRWFVKVDPYTISTLRYVKTEVTLVFTAAFPYAESIGTTLDEFTFDSELWQIGQGLIAEELFYRFNTSSFSIYNAGDVMINPLEMPLVIRVYGISENLSIRNKTTGDFWSYFGSATSIDDVIELNGVRSLKNGQSIFSKTNYNLIRIAPGWNDFQISGFGSGPFQIEFDFRFYYL